MIQELRKIRRDIGWAIVTLLEHRLKRQSSQQDEAPPAELVTIANRRSLIVVNRHEFRRLPGVNIIPLNDDRAFLALDNGRGMSDLELAVVDRLDDPLTEPRERQALTELRAQLKTWRHDWRLRFHCRSIIVVEELPKNGRRG